MVKIEGARMVYIYHDILEIIRDYKLEPHHKHIDLKLTNVPYVDTIILNNIH